MHSEGGLRPMLFDLETDPDEFVDLIKTNPDHPELERLYGYLAQWGRRMSQRVTKSDAQIVDMRGKAGFKGVLPYLYDEDSAPDFLTVHYRGDAPQLPEES